MNDAWKNLFFGLSTRNDGAMNLHLGESKITQHNREAFFARQNVSLNRVIFPFLQHGVEIAIVDKSNCNEKQPLVDALLSNDPEVVLALTCADCAPVYFFDPIQKAFGLVHAGWRGVEKNINGKVVWSFLKNFSSQARDLKVMIGPHLQACHFEIKNDLIQLFSDYQEFIVFRENKAFLELGQIIKKQLLLTGVLPENIIVSKDCTYCQKNRYFSYRRTNPKLEVMVAYLGLK